MWLFDHLTDDEKKELNNLWEQRDFDKLEIFVINNKVSSCVTCISVKLISEWIKWAIRKGKI